MNDDILTRERVYQSKEVADFLGIGSSTLRKWALLLEQEEYMFTRDDNNRRLFLERDVMTLKRMKELTKDGTMSLENAAIALGQRSKMSATQERTQIIETEQNDVRPIERFNEMFEQINALVQHTQSQGELIRKQEALIQSLIIELENKEKMNDQRHNALLEELNAVKDQVSATQENRSFWRRMFGK